MINCFTFTMDYGRFQISFLPKASRANSKSASSCNFFNRSFSAISSSGDRFLCIADSCFYTQVSKTKVKSVWNIQKKWVSGEKGIHSLMSTITNNFVLTFLNSSCFFFSAISFSFILSLNFFFSGFTSKRNLNQTKRVLWVLYSHGLKKNSDKTEKQ